VSRFECGTVHCKDCETGSGETLIALTGVWLQGGQSTIQRGDDRWLIRGLAMGGLVRVIIEVSDSTAVGDPNFLQCLGSSIAPDVRLYRCAGAGPNVQQLLRALDHVPQPEIVSEWVADEVVAAGNYCEVELLASAKLHALDAPLLVAYMKALMGSRHDSQLMQLSRHDRPLVYEVRESAIEYEGRVEMRVRLGGNVSTCGERLAAASATASHRLSERGWHDKPLSGIRESLATAADGGGQAGVVAFDLAAQMLNSAKTQDVGQALSRVEGSWAHLDWRVVHNHASSTDEWLGAK
jgi:hypothetical protein